MRRSSSRWLYRAALTALILVAVGVGTGHARYGWTFTYQGEITESGVPMNGTAAMSFKLFDSAVGGIQAGPTLNQAAVPLTNGRFTVALDFTAGGVVPGIFDGNTRFLDITVNGTPLTPRQELTITPHAAIATYLQWPMAARTVAPNAFHLESDTSAPFAQAMRVITTSADTSSVAITGEATTVTNMNTAGVFGRSYGANGFGVIGANESLVGNCSGVYGSATSNAGIGVFGWAASSTGPTRGVMGRVQSPDGYAGYFEGRGYFSQAVGIRTVGDPQAMLDIQSGDPLTGLAMKVNNEFYVDHTNNFVGVNRSNRIGAEYFGVRATATGTNYGGMYVETTSATGKPFYGYAADGVARGWTYFDAATDLWHLNLGGNRITVDRTTGDVGLGRTPVTNDLEVEGTASKSTAGGWLANSDRRIKTDVRAIDGALARLDRVRLVNFRYTDEYRRQHPDIEDRDYANVIAQEFREVFPDDVRGSGEKLENGEEILQVDTYPLTIYSAAAVQELHAMMREKDEQIAEQKRAMTELESRITKLESQLGSKAFQSASVVR